MKKISAKTILYMSFCTFWGFIITFITAAAVMANSSSAQSVKEVVITVQFEDATIQEAFEDIEGKTEFKFLYENPVVDSSPMRVNIERKTATVEQILIDISAQTGMRFRQIDSTIAVSFPKDSASADELIEFAGSITGKVTDAETGDPLPSANVYISELERGTATDSEGNYELTNIPNGSYTVRITYIGYQQSEGRVTVNDGATTYNFALKRDIASLGEVQVVGYGEQSERFVVQSISDVEAEDFENQPVLSAQEALQGQAAGVQVVGASGVLGAASNVRIRGVTSLVDNKPLYVVDGVPLNDRNYAQGFGELSLNPIAEINPQDIETISVLKDAAATAIYGSRGSNGVVLITTKSGSFNEKTKFTANYYTGWSRPTYVQDPMNGDEARQFVNDYALGGMFDPDDPDDPFFGSRQASFDWPDAVFRTGNVNNYSLSASGGSEQTSFYVAGTYFNQSSYLIGNEADKISGRVNLDHSAHDNFRFGLNLGISRLDNNRVNSGTNANAPLFSAYLQLPWNEPRDENGEFVQTGFPTNAIAYEELVDNTTLTNRITGNVNVAWDLLPTLTAKTDFGIDRLQLEQSQRTPFFFAPPTAGNTGGFSANSITQDNKWVSTTTLNYLDEFDGTHRLDALAGYAFETAEFSLTGVQGTGFISDDLPNVGSASNQIVSNALTSEYAIVSLFSRVNYTLSDKYIVELSVRRDGSSRFGENNQYGNFWTASGGWIISEEAFMDDVEVVDYLKLSTSYGTSGSDRILNDFGPQGLYTTGTSPNYAGQPGLSPQTAANPDLTWEETSQLDISLDTELFNQRLEVSASYYVKNTENLLQFAPQPYTTGFGLQARNIGEIRNKGVDLHITSTNVRSDDFNWSTSFNIGFLDNEVIDLSDDNIDSEGRAFTENAFQRSVEGETMNNFFLIRYSGIDPETGEAQWLTKDGELTTTPTSADRVLAGSALPDFTGSLRNIFSYKNLELSFSFNFVYGNKVFGGSGLLTDNPALALAANLNSRLLDYWQEPGDDAYAPGPNAATRFTFTQPSTLFLFDGSYIRLRNITLGYNLPQSLLSKASLRQARVYIKGQNLLTFSELRDRGIDPESNFGSFVPTAQGISLLTPPQAKTITIGINLGF